MEGVKEALEVKDLLVRVEPTKEKVCHKDTILEILARAADDPKYLARLAENPRKALEEYGLTCEERVALASGDMRRIESWVGKLDERLMTWLMARLTQEKW